MSRSRKLLEKIRNNPKAVSFEDLDKALRQAGFVPRQPKSGSSHVFYTLGSYALTVPYKRPYVKEVYVKQALDFIDEVLRENEQES